ncbi:MAG: filamentous hemagglutinin N-terminal domain-containing protein [Rhodocyclaceae bacterium]|nr:filamentous hemagglutinin N-terminal domain-containing protein [Rhodocyclaceae bacterium]
MKLHTTTSIRSSSRRPFRARTRFMVAAVSGCFAAGVLANPVGPSVVAGTASIAQIGKTMTVTNSAGAILNWNQFSIAAGETTRFIQPTASSAVLNRVLGADPSQIYGTLSSNGKVWLINPAGILVGASGRVDTAGFVASTLGVSNSDFLAGRLNFGSSEGGTSGIGAVVNQGAITTSAGGSVYLVAPNVVNQGIITTPQGETILAAGQTVHLVDTGTPGVKVEITGADGNATNLGDIVADAGRIGIAGVMVRNSGTLNASSVVSEGGRVFLKASQDAYVDGAGRIVTTGTKGGSVEVLGNRVAVMDTASIDASGTGDGGSIKVGGDYQGKNPDVQNATVTYFGPDASLKADAGSVGAGGTVIVWADDTTRAYGSISARGGADGGDGGFVETSGKRYLSADGISVDTRAPQGKTGTWLLDPTDITIAHSGTTTTVTVPSTSLPPPLLVPAGDVILGNNANTATVLDSTINTNLNTTNVYVTTGGSGTAPNGGSITVNNDVIVQNSSGAPRQFAMAADTNISVAYGAKIQGSTGSPLTVRMSAGKMNPDGTVITAGNLDMQGNIKSFGGDVLLKAAGDMVIGNSGAIVLPDGITNTGTGINARVDGEGPGSSIRNQDTGVGGHIRLNASGTVTISQYGGAQTSNTDTVFGPAGGVAIGVVAGDLNILPNAALRTTYYGGGAGYGGGDIFITNITGGPIQLGIYSATAGSLTLDNADLAQLRVSSPSTCGVANGCRIWIGNNDFDFDDVTETNTPVTTGSIFVNNADFGTADGADVKRNVILSTKSGNIVDQSTIGFGVRSFGLILQGEGAAYGGASLAEAFKFSGNEFGTVMYGGANIAHVSAGTLVLNAVGSPGSVDGWYPADVKVVSQTGSILLVPFEPFPEESPGDGGTYYVGKSLILETPAGSITLGKAGAPYTVTGGIGSDYSISSAYAAKIVGYSPSAPHQDGGPAPGYTGTTSVTLTASSNLNLDRGTSIFARTVTLDAGNDIIATGARIGGRDGDADSTALSLIADNDVSITDSHFETNGAAMSILSAGDITVTATLGGGSVLSTASCTTPGSPSCFNEGTYSATGTQTIKAGYNVLSPMAAPTTGSVLKVAAGQGGYGAAVVSGGAQTISADRIEVYGGATGVNNGAFISKLASANTLAQTITAHDIWLEGGGTAPTDGNLVALIESISGTQTINVTSSAGDKGSLTIKGGPAGVSNRAGIFLYSDPNSVHQELNVHGDVLLAGGGNATSYGNFAVVRSFATQTLNIYDGGSVVLQGGMGSGTSPQSRSDNLALIRTTVGNQTIQFHGTGGGIELIGGDAGTFNYARIANDGVGTQNIVGAASIELTAGDSPYARAEIFAQGGQYIETNQLTLTGGGGNAYDSIAVIEHGYNDMGGPVGSGYQTIVMTGTNATLTLQGGSGNGQNPNGTMGDPIDDTSGNFAKIKSSVGGQTIMFIGTGGSLSVTGGSGGSNGLGNSNGAGIISHQDQTIGGYTFNSGEGIPSYSLNPANNPNVLVQGGSSGGANYVPNSPGENERGNDAGIFGGDNDDGGDSVSTLNFKDLTINGGTALYGQAGVGGDLVHLTVTGNAALTGGSSNEVNNAEDVANATTAAYIVHDDEGYLDLHVIGNLTLTGGSGTSGIVVVGGLVETDLLLKVDGNLNVNLPNSQPIAGAVTIGAIGVNPLSGEPLQGGNANVIVRVGGDITLNGGTTATGTVLVGSPDDKTGQKVAYGGAIPGGTCEDMDGCNTHFGSAPVYVELVAAKNITINGGTMGVTVGVTNPSPTDDAVPDSAPSSDVVLAAGAIYTNAGEGGFVASVYGGNIVTSGRATIRTDSFSDASINLVAFERGSGAADTGSITLATNSLVAGDDIAILAGGNLELGGSVSGSSHVSLELAAGRNASNTAASTRGGNVIIQSGGTVSNTAGIDIRAGAGTAGSAGDITINGSLEGSGLITASAQRNINVGGSITTAGENSGISLSAGESSFGGNVTLGTTSMLSATGYASSVSVTAMVGSTADGAIEIQGEPGEGGHGGTISSMGGYRVVVVEPGIDNGYVGYSYTEFGGGSISIEASGNIALGENSQLHSQGISVQAGGDLTLGGLIQNPIDYDTYVNLSAGDNGEGASARGGNVWLKSTSNTQAYGGIYISASAGTQTGAGGNVTHDGYMSSSYSSDAFVNMSADRNITINGSIISDSNDSADTGRNIRLTAGDNNTVAYGGDIVFGTGSKLFANASRVQASAFGGSESAGNITQQYGGLIWGNYTDLHADGDLTVNGSVGSRYYTKFEAGLNRHSGRGGDVMFGANSVVNPENVVTPENMVLFSSSSVVVYVDASGGTESPGNITQVAGAKIYSGDAGLYANGNIQIDGLIDALGDLYIETGNIGSSTTNGNIVLGELSKLYGDYISIRAEGDLTVGGVIANRGDANDYYPYTDLSAGDEGHGASQRGGNVWLKSTSVISSVSGDTYIWANAGTVSTANGGTVTHEGELTSVNGSIEIWSDRDILINGTITTQSDIDLTAGYNESLAFGGDVVFGGSTSTLPRAPLVSSNSSVTVTAYGGIAGSTGKGNVVQHKGTIEAINATIYADGNVAIDGKVDVESSLSIRAGGVDYYTHSASGGDIVLGVGSEVVANDVHLDAYGGSAALGEIVQNGGTISAGYYAGMRAEGNVTLNALVVADSIDVYAGGSVSQGTGGVLTADSNLEVYAAGNVDLLGAAGVADGGEGYVSIYAGYQEYYKDINGNYQPGLGEQTYREKHITISSLTRSTSSSYDSVYLSATGPITATVHNVNYVEASIANSSAGGISITASGTTVPGLSLYDFADSETSAKFTWTGGDLVVTRDQYLEAGYGGVVAFAAPDGSLDWSMSHYLGGTLPVLGGTLSLSARDAITQSALIEVATLTTGSGGVTNLTGYGGSANVVNTYNVSNGATGQTSFNAAGDLVVGTINSVQLVALGAAGAITQSGTITAGSLHTDSVSGTTLTGNNSVKSFSADNSDSGNITLNNAAVPLTIVAINNAAGNVAIDNTGAVVISGALTATGTVDVTAHSPLTVTSTGTVTAGSDVTLTAMPGATGGTLVVAGSVSTAGGVIEFGGSTVILATTSEVTATDGGTVLLGAFGTQGDIIQHGGLISASGDVVMLADRNVSLNGQINADGELAVLAGFNQLATAGGNILLGATSNVTAGDISLTADRDTGTGAFSTGNVSQQAGSTWQTGNDFLINASGNIDMLGTVVGNAAGRTNLLAGFNNTTGTEQAFTGAHVTANNLQANGGSVSIQATAGINAVVQSAGVVGANINNSAAGGLNLTSYGASAFVLVDNSVSASAVNLTYKNAPLTLGANSALVTGNGAGKVNVTASGGNLVYSGANVSANGVSFTSTGTISQTAPVTTSVLYTSSAGGTTLTADNVVGTYSGVNTSSGNLAFKSVKTGGLVLAGPAATAVQNLAATGDINITSAGAGALSVNGAVSSLRNVSFSSAGAINAASKLTGTGLNSVSVGGASYTGPNQIATVVNMSNTGSGNVVFNNTAAPLTIEAISNSAGNVTVDNTGAVVINGPMTASGALSVTAHSPITVTSTGSVKAGGDLDLIASSTSFRSTIDLLTIGGEVLSDNGNIGLFGGSGIAVTAKVTATNGNVVAESPFGDITETPAGLITAPKGTVTLNANSEGPKPEDIVVVPPAEAQTINTIDAIVEVQVVAVLPTSSGSGSSRTLGDETTGGTPGTFGGGEEKKEEEKKDSNGASTSADDKPAAQRSVGACT